MKYKQMLKTRKTEKDPQVRDRIFLNVLVKRDGMSVTGAARLLGMAPSWGVRWHSRYLKEGIAGLTDRVACIAEAYGRLEFKFGTTLANAAPDLFTFVRHPGMHPTNNESERMLRRVVIHRKIRQRLVTPAGMRMFGVLMTCVMTWRRQKADLMGNLLGVLGAA